MYAGYAWVKGSGGHQSEEFCGIMLGSYRNANRWLRSLAVFVALFSPQLLQSSVAGESVVVLHGLARTSDSMSRMASALEAAGYHVCNVSYPSRKHSIEVLSASFVAPAVRACRSSETDTVHFVTHSLGGIVVRQLAKSQPDLKIGRVVMLSPPNHGSEVVDRLGTLTLFTLINGPAGLQLATGEEFAPRSLGPASFDVGIITGSRTVNPILSLMIPGTDDGKVSIESAKLEGMTDFCVIPASHPFIMNNERAIGQTLSFLAEGRFTCNVEQSV
jgi:triacylglycerol lipase